MTIENSLQLAIKNAIKECDFIVLIYTQTNPYIAFEAGIACAFGKPIFAIVSSSDDEPDFLHDSTCVHSLPTEVDKIKFNFDIFFKNIKPRKSSQSPKKIKYYGGGEPISIYYDKFYNIYNSLNKNLESQYELLFKDIFETYHLNVIKNKFESTSNFYADFCIWSDQLNSILGNPILIEIKKEINSKNLPTLLKNIASNSNTSSFLVFYESLKGVKKGELPNNPKCLFIQLSDFI